MNFTAFCILLACLQVSAGGHAQTVTISLKEAPVEKVFQEIKKQTGYFFLYNNEVLTRVGKVDIQVKNSTVEQALDICFKNKEVSFKIFDNTVVVKLNTPKVQTNTTDPITVKGKVSNENGELLAGVSVKIKGTTRGTTTDENGVFSISIPDDALKILVFSFVGMQPREVNVSKKSEVNLILASADNEQREVVVIGYGTQRKSDLTGAVSSVKGDQLTEYPAINTIQALQGKSSGVLIQSNNGEPGSEFKVRVRGQTSINAGSDPLYVVDGFVGAPLPAPEDIASIDILKDASATAIYGSRGANGVIIITTKTGRSGKTRITLNASNSSQKVINKLNLLNADQFVDYIKEANPNYVRGTGNTDWQDVILRQGNIQNYQLGIAGGSEKVNYYVSGTYFDQQGIVIHSKYKRLSVQSNVSFQATDKLKMGINLLLRRIDRDGVRSQEFSGGDGSGVLSAAVRFAPDLPIYNPDGSFSLNSIGDPGDNPYAIATQVQNNSSNDEMVASAFGEYQLIKGLKLRVNAGANTSNGRTGNYIPTTLNQGRNVDGIASLYGFHSTNFLNEDYLTYTTQLAPDHNLNLVAGYSYQKIRAENFGGQGQDFITDAFSFWNLGSANTYLAPSSGMAETELISGYGRVNYSFMNRYMLTFTGRYDGYSAFSRNNKYAFFPSGAFAWNAKEEKFLDDVKWLNQFKIRTSYGLTGNQAIDPYQTLARLSTEIAVIGGQQVTAVRPTSVANDNLTWETTAQFNAGIDLGIFNSRINLSADYYKKTTSDLLFSVPLPQYTGYSTQLQNIGKVENKGYEFTLTTKNMTGLFKWTTDFNISFNKNKIIELPGGQDIFYGAVPGHMVGTGSMQVLRVGQPVGMFYGYIYDGVYQEGDAFVPGSGFEEMPGGEKYRDINGRDADSKLTNKPDGQLDEDDKTIIGNPHPKFIWALNNEFKWKGVDLTIFFQASQGNDLYSFTLAELGRNSGGNNATTKESDHWTPSYTNTDVAAVNPGRAFIPSSQWVFDGSYIRLKNIMLGYTLPEQINERIKIRSLRFYISAQNILTFTKYKGYDPEVNYLSGGGPGGNLNLGLDYGSYPNAKSVTFGINVGF